MARYSYKCTNDKCADRNKKVEITKPMAKSDREELCATCNGAMFRDYSGATYGISTGDGFKN